MVGDLISIWLYSKFGYLPYRSSHYEPLSWVLSRINLYVNISILFLSLVRQALGVDFISTKLICLGDVQLCYFKVNM